MSEYNQIQALRDGLTRLNRMITECCRRLDAHALSLYKSASPWRPKCLEPIRKVTDRIPGAIKKGFSMTIGNLLRVLGMAATGTPAEFMHFDTPDLSQQADDTENDSYAIFAQRTGRKRKTSSSIRDSLDYLQGGLMDWHLIHSFIIEQLQIIQDHMQDDAYVLRYYDTLDGIIAANPPQEPEHEVWLLLNRIFQNMNDTSLDQLDDKLLTREHVTDLKYCNLDIRETFILMKAAVKEDASATDRSRYAAHISSTIQANTPRG